MPLDAWPRSWLVGLAAAGVGLALVQTLRLWARVARVRWTLRRRAEHARAGEVEAAALLERAGYTVLAAQAARHWSMRVDGDERPVALRADYLVERGARRYVAEVKTGERAPEPSAAATRRQLLEYRCAFDVDGVLLVDADAGRLHEIEFALPGARPRRRVALVAFLVGLALGLGAAAVARDLIAAHTPHARRTR